MDDEVEKLQEELKELREMVVEDRQERAYDRKRIALLEKYKDGKTNNNRRDWNVLRWELKEQVLKERFGMNYKDIRFFSDFKSDPEAYRLMRSTVKQYPLEVKLHKGKGSAKGIEMIVARRV